MKNSIQEYQSWIKQNQIFNVYKYYIFISFLFSFFDFFIFVFLLLSLLSHFCPPPYSPPSIRYRKRVDYKAYIFIKMLDMKIIN